MLVFHSPPLTLSKYFKKIYFNFKAWLWGPPPCEVWYCLPPDCCLSDALEDLLKPHWGKPRERKKAPEKQEVFTCSRNTRQNKTKKKPFLSFCSCHQFSQNQQVVVTIVALLIFLLFPSLPPLLHSCVCRGQRLTPNVFFNGSPLPRGRISVNMALTDVRQSRGCMCPSIFCLCILSSGIAGWPCHLSGYYVSLKHPQAGRANYFSPRPSADSAREQGKRLHVTVDGLLWEKPGYKRCSLEEVTTVFIWLTIAPSGNETFGKGHTALIPWLAGR